MLKDVRGTIGVFQAEFPPQDEGDKPQTALLLREEWSEGEYRTLSLEEAREVAEVANLVVDRVVRFKDVKPGGDFSPLKDGGIWGRFAKGSICEQNFGGSYNSINMRNGNEFKKFSDDEWVILL